MAVGNVGSLDIGKYLKIYSTKGVYNNLSEECEFWKFIMKKRVAKPEGREVRYNLRTALGQSAFQFLNPGAEGSFPGQDRSVLAEAIAYFKDFGTTVDVPRHLLNKTGSELAQYGEPLAEELDAKGIATARGLSRTLTGDGTGSLGKVASASVSSSKALVVLSAASADAGKSHIGWFQHNEKVQVAEDDGTIALINTNVTPAYWRVEDINIETDTLRLTPYTSGDVALTVSTLDEVVAGAFIYPFLDGTNALIPDQTSISDYGTASSVWAGLESLASADNRLVNSINTTGNLKGSRVDAGANAIDRTHFASLMSKLKRAVGQNRYKYSQAVMFDTVYDALLESWETDRQIINISDDKRGSKGLGYTHRKDSIEFVPDEFCQKSRIWVCPEGDVLHYRGTDIEQVEVDGVKFHMPQDSSGNTKRNVRTHMEGSGLLFSTHNAAIGVIENFTV